MSMLMQASQQWAKRPDDERFVSLTDLQAYAHRVRQQSSAKVLPNRVIQAAPLSDDSTGRALVITGPNGHAVTPTHWAFGQLAQRAGAPSGYLRDLPAPLAADCINYGLASRDVEELGVLLTRGDAATHLTAVTGPNYGRIWNATILDALVNRFGDGVTGAFKVPGEFGKDVPITKKNTTLYASDRDMFVFLADEHNRIEVPNRRDGQAGSLARGFFVWNSEVGNTTFGIGTFLFDYVCMNRIVWGAEGYQEIKIRHTSGAPHRWIEEAAPALEAYAQSSTAGITALITDARSKRLDNVQDFLAKRFTRPQVAAIQSAHMADECRPIETLWDAVTGATAYARGIQHQDARVTIERTAGQILDMAA